MQSLELKAACAEAASFSHEARVDPTLFGGDIDYQARARGSYQDYNIGVCSCPCPKISAPVWAAGFVVFSPLL